MPDTHKHERLTREQLPISFLRRQHFISITQMKDAKTFIEAKARITQKKDAKTFIDEKARITQIKEAKTFIEAKYRITQIKDAKTFIKAKARIMQIKDAKSFIEITMMTMVITETMNAKNSIEAKANLFSPLLLLWSENLGAHFSWREKCLSVEHSYIHI